MSVEAELLYCGNFVSWWRGTKGRPFSDMQSVSMGHRNTVGGVQVADLRPDPGVLSIHSTGAFMRSGSSSV